MSLPPIERLGAALASGWQRPTSGLVQKSAKLLREGLAPPWAPHLYHHSHRPSAPLTRLQELVEVRMLLRHVTPGSSVSAVGLAYPQLAAASKGNLAITAVQFGMLNLRAESRTPDVRLLVNPRYEPVEESGRIVRLESCLSSPGIGVAVERWSEIRLHLPGQAPQRVGETTAWILQHEIDHLGGVLCTDLALSQKRPELRQLYFVPPEWHQLFFRGGFKVGDEWPVFPRRQYDAYRSGDFDLAKYL